MVLSHLKDVYFSLEILVIAKCLKQLESIMALLVRYFIEISNIYA